jgi:hypothetical protein
MDYDGADVPPKLLAKLRSLCLVLPEAYEEPAWVGVRWAVRKRTFAHVLTIFGGRPRAYARAAGSDGPLVVLTFRSKRAHRPPYFRAVWGTKWGAQVIGLPLEGRIKWSELAALIDESYRLVAPKKLTGE